MRILQLVPSLSLGGAQRFVVDLSVALSDLGHEVAVLTTFGREISHPEFEARLARAGIERIVCGKRLGFDPRMYYRLARRLAVYRPDVAHSHLSIQRYALPSLVVNGIPAVHTLHTLAQYENDWAGKLVLRIAFAAGVRPVAIASAVQESVVSVYGKRAPVVAHGIPVDTYRLSPPVREDYRNRLGWRLGDTVVVWVGRLDHPKAPGLVVEAAAPLIASKSTFRLAFVGEGALRKRLEEQVAFLGIRERVDFLGARGDIPQILAASDLFVLATEWEGSPLAILEARAAGLPIVATAVGGIPEMVMGWDATWLVPPGDAGELRSALEAALPHIGSSDRTKVDCSRFDIRETARAYLSLYELANFTTERRQSRAVR